MSSHDSLHQFATLRLKTYILARKGRELLVACRPPRGLTPPPPGDGHGTLPRPLWEWVGWLWMGGNAG